MPSWIQIVAQMQQNPAGLDQVRRQYITSLANVTGRNVIAYYSGWLQRKGNSLHSTIYDGDMNSFMTVVHGMDTRKGLDLILHTPGGNPTATEGIVRYLRKKFKTDIRCFVPQAAFSAGTMLACACREIYMGSHSSLGPIDPQFGPTSAFAILEEFKTATRKMRRSPASIPIWQAIYSKINPGFLIECENAIKLSSEMVGEWLKTGMFLDCENAEEIARQIVKKLNNHAETKTHGRHIDAEQARSFGLKVIDLERDQTLQDAVLSVHYACIQTFFLVQSLQKLVENQNGVGMFIND